MTVVSKAGPLHTARAARTITRFSAKAQQSAMLPSLLRHSLFGALLICAAGHACADNAELNIMLEDNAAAAAHSRLCGDEPKSDLLKANTMLLLAFSGLEAQNIQLGSAKFNDILRQEIRAKRAPKSLNCEETLASADAKLQATREALAKVRGGN